MAISTSSGVYVVETDLSDVIPALSSSIGAIVFASKRGPVNKRTFITNTKQWIDTFGKPNSAVSYAHHQAVQFLTEASALWGVRVVGSGATYGTAVFQKKTASASGLFVAANATPSTMDLAAVINGSTLASEENLAAFYAIGPGAYASTIQVEIESKNMLPVGVVTATNSASGGTLAADSYAYDVTAVNASGETISGTGGTVVVASGTTNSITLVWGAVVGATQYRIYGRTAGSKLYLGTTTTPTFVDTGAVTPAGATAPVAYTGTDEFYVNVYDTEVSASKPVESYLCTLKAKVDGFGTQMELEGRINPFSRYIQVQNRADGFTNSAFVTSVAKTSLTGAADGSAVTNSQINLGWELFRDPTECSVNILINGGYSASTVHVAIDNIAAARQDAIAILDMPSDQQTAPAAMSYRQTLGLNSNYSAIYTPDLLVQDNYNGVTIYVPPAGHIAAIYARTDRVAEPWYAPAGLSRGALSVLGVRNVYTQGERDLLQASQINYVRQFPAQGYAVMEAYTLQTNSSALSFIPVRRMLNVIETAVGRALLFKLWEPNDDFVRRQIVGMVSEYLTTIQQRRGLNKFSVVADSSNNGPSSVGQGTLNIDVYLEPTLPVARIKLQMVVTRSGMDFKEAVSLAGSQ
jgi:phage tail sheath protein FI